jgi:hypothetical protein
MSKYKAGNRDRKYVIFSGYDTRNRIQSLNSNCLTTILSCWGFLFKSKTIKHDGIWDNKLRIYFRKLSTAHRMWLIFFAYWTSGWPGVRFARLVFLFYCLYDWLTCFTMYTSGYPVLTRYMFCRHASQFVRIVYLLCVLHVWLNSFTLLIECKPMSYVIIYYQCYLFVWCYNAIVYLKRLRQQIAFWLIPVFFLLYFQHLFNICWNEILQSSLIVKNSIKQNCGRYWLSC